MMVIKGNLAADSRGTPQSTGRIFPADRCTWEQADSADNYGYHLTNARFYDGTGDAVPIASPILGFIGKSGRFVAMTDAT